MVDKNKKTEFACKRCTCYGHYDQQFIKNHDSNHLKQDKKAREDKEKREAEEKKRTEAKKRREVRKKSKAEKKEKQAAKAKSSKKHQSVPKGKQSHLKNKKKQQAMVKQPHGKGKK